jgi:hypothetical protein
LGELIVEAFQAWTPAKGVKTGTLTPSQVEALIEQKLAEVMTRQVDVVVEPTPPAPSDPLPPVVEGLKWCGKRLHQYAATRKECPQCATLRKRAQREKQAAQKRGDMPAL